MDLCEKFPQRKLKVGEAERWLKNARSLKRQPE
jgi:hypothetical protein